MFDSCSRGIATLNRLANGCDASGIGICLDPEGIKAISQAVEFHETPGALRIEMPIDPEGITAISRWLGRLSDTTGPRIEEP